MNCKSTQIIDTKYTNGTLTLGVYNLVMNKAYNHMQAKYK